MCKFAFPRRRRSKTQAQSAAAQLLPEEALSEGPPPMGPQTAARAREAATAQPHVPKSTGSDPPPPPRPKVIGRLPASSPDLLYTDGDAVLVFSDASHVEAYEEHLEDASPAFLGGRKRLMWARAYVEASAYLASLSYYEDDIQGEAALRFCELAGYHETEEDFDMDSE